MVLWLILEKIYSLIANDLHTKATTKVANSTVLALKINAPVTPLQKYSVEGGGGGGGGGTCEPLTKILIFHTWVRHREITAKLRWVRD